ncbi:MAG: hypothetical protein AW08_01291 [Candidatus Accumulibacter adjunctus]|uniref:DUF3567 domain-containing protein n=1 Tax=Candidatus Accumulibacter adjunctus TaxID=1454001 RepID=A0A011PQC0_9PROT|nr:MAG: hypothetical protein AW08_01291 [Candidatus Accumulibacter adjunctus]
MMSIVYNSQQYAIVAYPTHEALELVDKTCSRSLFVQGAVAGGLRRAIESIPDEQRSEESVDALLDEYCAGKARPIVLH